MPDQAHPLGTRQVPPGTRQVPPRPGRYPQDQTLPLTRQEPPPIPARYTSPLGPGIYIPPYQAETPPGPGRYTHPVTRQVPPPDQAGTPPPPEQQTLEYGQHSAGTHPTGMHSYFVKGTYPKRSKLNSKTIRNCTFQETDPGF